MKSLPKSQLSLYMVALVRHIVLIPSAVARDAEGRMTPGAL